MDSPDPGNRPEAAPPPGNGSAAAPAEGPSMASRLDRLTLLYEVGRSLASMVRLDDLLDGIVAAAADVMQARASSLMLVESDGANLTFEVAFGEKGQQLKGIRIPINDESVAGTVARHGEPLIVDDVRAIPFF